MRKAGKKYKRNKLLLNTISILLYNFLKRDPDFVDELKKPYVSKEKKSWLGKLLDSND